MYIADTHNNRFRKVTISTGVITTIAGTGTATYSGDNGQATSAALYYPCGVNVDSSGKAAVVHNFIIYSVLMHSLLLGNVYIADTFNNRVRKVTISTATSSPRYSLIAYSILIRASHHSLILLPAQSRVHHQLSAQGMKSLSPPLSISFICLF